MKQRLFQTILVLALAMTCLSAGAQVNEFEKYADSKGVTYVYISKFMLGLASKSGVPSLPGMNTKSIMGKLDGIQIISSENKSALTRLKNDTQNIVKQGKYQLLMQMDEDGEKVRIYYREGKQKSVVIMLTEESDEVVVMVFSGKFTLDDVMKMMK